MTEPGKATLSDMPAEGANLTAYAISPDGKEWHYATLAVAPPPKE